MTDFENIVIGKSSVPALAITVVLMLAIPIGSFLFWYKKHKAQVNILYLIAGAAGFIVSARVLELGMHYLCIVMDNPVSRFINGNTAAFVLYGTVMAGVFEECGRFIVLKFILKKNRTRENAVLYGVGHGGIEILAVLLPSMALYLIIAILFSVGNAEDALSALKITDNSAAAALPSVQAAAAFDYPLMAMNVAERLLAMCAHIGLTVIVFYGIKNMKKTFLPSAILLHMAMDTFPALYQRDVIPLWSVEAWAAFWVAAIMLIAGKLYKKMKEEKHG
ncbi:MAG: YhfC family intramembrane metalloprotease [Clostridia bacterium]|nr:YhfC family intramembrane metalloprotease [Clostridia bacterium]